MGVPSFYKWLINKYPNCVVKALEEKGDCVDPSLPNPNKFEFDNLYLDMNGIIHPCFHPRDHPNAIDDDGPKTMGQVFDNIFAYVDHIFNIVRPRKLLFLAIDGVAPRAKMNQQRSRRFKTAKDNAIAEAEEQKITAEMEKEGKQVLPKEESEVTDSNVITPGTVFMYKLSEKLKEYITSRMTTNPGWKEIKVILSDANVPGEGEHKIMSFIRGQRSLAEYNKNTRHCLYGLDADLIMLALSTHEVHFSIIIEDVLAQEQQPFRTPAGMNLYEGSGKSRGWIPDVKSEDVWLNDDKQIAKKASFVKKPYQFLHVWILREYLELDMQIPNPPEKFTFDLERIIDDFIFICFFAGNDFLPYMPTLEINEGGIDLLMTVYKEQFKNMGGYLVSMQRVHDSKNGFIKLTRVEKFILQVGMHEEKIFKKRSELRERRLRRLHEYPDVDGQEQDGENSNITINPGLSLQEKCTSEQLLENTKQLKEKLRLCLRQNSDLFKSGSFVDLVKLGMPGWRERYYRVKFSAEGMLAMEAKRKEIVEKYTEGLLWSLLYYFSGVPSWTWYYPYHYGPFASDFKGLAQTQVKFKKGVPFKPFDQLMGVLPPRSAHALPTAYQRLMTDDNSEIIDFYPADFDIDVDGKRFLWQGICKLPFINEERLLTATKKIEKDLESSFNPEAERNMEKFEMLFVRKSSIDASQYSSLVSNLIDGEPNDSIQIHASSSGVGGFVQLSAVDFSVLSIDERSILCLQFDPPKESQFIPRPLEGVEFPPKTITESDIEDYILARILWKPTPSPKVRFPTTSFTVRSVIFFSKSTHPIIRGDHTRVLAQGVWSGRGRGRGRTDRNEGAAGPRELYFGPCSGLNYGRGRGSGFYGSRSETDMLQDLRISGGNPGVRVMNEQQHGNQRFWDRKQGDDANCGWQRTGAGYNRGGANLRHERVAAPRELHIRAGSRWNSGEGRGRGNHGMRISNEMQFRNQSFWDRKSETNANANVNDGRQRSGAAVGRSRWDSGHDHIDRSSSWRHRTE